MTRVSIAMVMVLWSVSLAKSQVAVRNDVRGESMAVDGAATQDGLLRAGGSLTDPATALAPPKPFTSVACVGDSLTEGVDGDPSCKQLAALSGLPTYNLGISGQASGQMAVRLNAYAGKPEQTFGSTFTLPTRGSVACTFAVSGYEPAYKLERGLGPYVNGVPIAFRVGGTAYTVNVLDNGDRTYACTPTAYPPSPVTVPEGTAWTAVTGAWLDSLVVIRAGRNDPTQTAQVEADIAAMVARMQQGSGQYLVLGVQNRDDPAREYRNEVGYDFIILLNLHSASAYPGHYLDLRANLVAKTCAQDDLADQFFCANDVPGIYVRALNWPGNLIAAMGARDSTYCTSAQPGSTTIVDSEWIENASWVAGGSCGSGYTVTAGYRGFNGTTAASHANGTVFKGYDSGHESVLGDGIDAALIYAWMKSSGASKPIPSITWATPAAITYGTALGSAQLNAKASVPGILAYSPTAGAVPSTGLQVLSVTFTPTDTADYSTAKAWVALVVNPATTVKLSKTGLAFGGQPLNTISASQPLTLTNTGAATLTFSAALTGSGAGSFSKWSGCPGALAPGASCIINVQFKPTSAGAASAALTLIDNAGNSPQSVTLSGTGLGAAISLSQASLVFGGEALNTTSAAHQLTLTNSGATTLTCAAALTGASAGSFSKWSNCAGPLAPRASCTIYVQFKPTSAGAASAALTFTGNATNSPQGVTLSGTGLGAAMSLSQTSLKFGIQKLNAISAAQSLTVTNSGAATLTFGGALTGASAGSFTKWSNCTGPLAPGAFCTIYLQFKPKATGAVSAALTFTDNSGNSPQSVTLSGTGQ